MQMISLTREQLLAAWQSAILARELFTEQALMWTSGELHFYAADAMMLVPVAWVGWELSVAQSVVGHAQQLRR
jgi:hypothetical protein